MKKIQLFVLFLLLILSMSLSAQNTVVTDDDSYSGNNSAVLDVYSKTKGLLVPRLTTAERQAISSPADGLLVYDATEKLFYVYSNSAWKTLDAPSIWQTSNDSIYVNGANKRYGVGTASPLAKLTVQGDATIAPDQPLFEVKNSAGDVIFAVYENEVKVNFKESAKGVKGGFAVGGLSGTKGDPIEYMRITPDSVRIYIDDSETKGVKGGFAVGGLSGTKGANEYFRLDDESASIYLKQPAKGVKGGFAVGGLSGTKAAGVNFLDLTPENYFIGEGAGSSITTGLYNSFMGYEAGFLNSEGTQNIFIGYQAGHNNQFGNWNTFLGFEAGLSNTGSDNTFIGYKAGRVHTSQGGNVHIGSKAGEFATNGEQNIFIGESAGSYNTNGGQNVFMGYRSGFSNQTGSDNVFIGNSIVQSTTASSQNVAIGNNVASDVTSNIFSSVIMGDNALTSMLASINVGNSMFIGKNAGVNLAENTISVTNCVFIGTNAGDGAKHESSGLWSIVALGNNSGSGTNGWRNVFIGDEAGMDFDGSYNTMIGFNVGQRGGSGDYNVYVGDQTALLANGDYNTYVGPRAGTWVNGNNNVFLGYDAGGAASSSPRTESNRLRIGSDNLIYGEFDNKVVTINGSFEINNTNSTNDIYINGTDARISLYGNEIGRLASGTGIDKDIIPFAGSVSGYDLGNNTATEHWDDVVAEGFVTYTKSEKLKSAGKMNLDIELLKSLEPVHYKEDETQGNRLKYGFTIESLLKVAPAAVVTEDTDFDEETNQYVTTKAENAGINYNAMLPVVVNFMQQQQTQIEELKKANEEMKELLNKIMNNE